MIKQSLDTYSGVYRFGFNTQERTDEIAGFGNHNTALFWEYDTRLGRRWNLDKVKKSWLSSYCSFSNNPIIFVDPTGDDDYYNKAGKWIGNDGQGTDIRIANYITTKEQFDYFKEQGADGIEILKSPEQSTQVTLCENSQDAVENLYLVSQSEKRERTAYIVLDIENATLTLEEQEYIPVDDPAHSSYNKYESQTGKGAEQRGGNYISIYGKPNLVIVGQVHGHPQLENEIVKPGVSEPKPINPDGTSDVECAEEMSIPVYAIDKNNIHKVGPDKKIENGKDKKMNLLIDALETNGDKK
jgi:hypothetical protein